MVIIEILVYVCIAAMTVFCVHVMNKARLAKRSDFIYSGVILSLIITQIFIITTQILVQTSPQIQDSNPLTALICIGAILALALIYFVTRITESSTEIQEYARRAVLSAMFILFGISFCAILVWLPETKVDLYRTPVALALCLGMAYYPSAFDRLRASRNGTEQNPEEHTDAGLDIATETGIEVHKETVVNLAIEAWRLAKVFERAITQLNVDKPRRYTSQIEWFVKNTEESLEDVGLRIVNVEGHPYDPGMAAAPVNLEEFDIDDSLEVNLMVEPIIMKGTVLVKRGKVFLRKIES